MQSSSIARGGRAYAAHGLRVASELRLPGLAEHRPSTEPDVELHLESPGPVPEQPPLGDLLLRLEVNGVTRYSAAFDGISYRLRFTECCEFTIDAERRHVACRPDPNIDPELPGILAAGALMAFLLTLDGATVLHASAVQIGEGALAVVGASGFGKSTVAALLCISGCPLIADDVLRIDLSNNGTVFTGAKELRLRNAARGLADQFRQPVTIRDTADGRLALGPPATALAKLPLSAIVIPRPRRDVACVSVRRNSGAEALSQLIAFPRMLGWRSKPVLRQQFEGLAELVQRVPVMEASVPWGPPFAARLGAEVIDALAGHLLSEAAW